MASVVQDTKDYEDWLRKQCAVVEEGLDAKHRRMRQGEFEFLRATYYRWARTIEALCPSLAASPKVLCIGDIHVENYGTWRDADARLVWGINDFDEAAVMPYAFDLVRLATSAGLQPHLGLTPHDIAAAILRGYGQGLKQPGPALVEEGPLWLRPYVSPTPKSNQQFWQDAAGWPAAEPPDAVKKALTGSLPDGARGHRFASRSKGGGSLGRPRFLVVATWNGGRVVREAKALVPSAWDWAHATNERTRLLDAAYGSFRSADPRLRIEAGFIVRRVAPDSRKIDVSDLQTHGLTADLLAAMGADLAAVHAASPHATAIGPDLQGRPKGWLEEATQIATQATKRDFAEYVAPT